MAQESTLFQQLTVKQSNNCRYMLCREFNKFVFGVNFSSWKHVIVYVNLDRNVLMRGALIHTDSFWLTPANFGSIGIQRCKKYTSRRQPIGSR